MDCVQNADGVLPLPCEKMFESYKGLFLPSPLSYDHLSSVIRKVLEEKPENVAGKFLICTIRFCILTTFTFGMIKSVWLKLLQRQFFGILAA